MNDGDWRRLLVTSIGKDQVTLLSVIVKKIWIWTVVGIWSLLLCLLAAGFPNGHCAFTHTLGMLLSKLGDHLALVICFCSSFSFFLFVLFFSPLYLPRPLHPPSFPLFRGGR